MSKPGNAPARCPRAVDASSGPRRCRFTSCPLHLRHNDGSGGHPQNERRASAARALPDTCSVDVSERAASSRTRQGIAALTFREIGVLLGTDGASAYRSYQRAVRKVRLRVIVDGR
jgi:hypothetical protein